MPITPCIARAYGDRPLRRIVCGRNRDTIWLLNPNQPDLDRLIEEGAGVGFPSDYVFEFEEGLFRRLEAAHAEGDRVALLAAWLEAKPLNASLVPKVEWA